MAGRQPPKRVTLGDIGYFSFVAAYAAGGLAVLGMGVGALVASASPVVHDAFHVWELGTGPLARASARMADASHYLQPWWQIALDYLFTVFNLALAVFLLWLRPRDRTARLLALGLIGIAGMFNLEAQSVLEQVPFTPLESVVQAGAHLVAGISYALALMLFPDGKLVPNRRLPAWGILGLILAGAGYLIVQTEGTARPASLIVFFGLVVPVAGVAAQGYRSRRSPNARDRQQARMLFWALVPALAIGILFVATRGFMPPTTEELAGRGLVEVPVIGFRVFQPVFAIIPIALFVGLVHYRLWDVDRVVNRTLVYAVLTGILGGAYFGIILLLQWAFRPFTQGQDLAVAASTLAVAFGFRPARHRIQAFVDRRFYRHKYDATKTIERFTSRLRDEIDLGALTGEIGDVVSTTMQPAHVSLWLREPDGHMSWAWTHATRPNGDRRLKRPDRNGSGTPQAYEKKQT